MRRKGFGRASPASKAEPKLRRLGDAATAWWRADGGTNGWCSLRAAAVVGVRHRLAGLESDDFYAWAQADDRIAVAVGDGLGSVEGSAGASQRACRAAVTEAVEAVAESAIDTALSSANRAARGGGATTLTLALIDRDGRCRLGRVGDSTGFCVDERGDWCEVFEPPDPDRVDRSTTSLPDHDPDIETVDVDLRPGMVLVLATDGVADPWRDGPTTVAPSLVAGMLHRPAPLALARLIDFSRQGCHDDRTAVCVWLTERLPGVGESVDTGAGERLHLDDVSAGWDQAGDEDGKRSE